MPIRFSIDPAKELVLTSVSGSILESDPLDYLASVIAHPDYRPGYRALIECRDVRVGSVTPTAIRRLATFTRDVESQLAGSRVALVAPQAAVFGLLRMYQLLRDPPYALAVFRERSEAEAWLTEAGPGGP